MDHMQADSFVPSKHCDMYYNNHFLRMVSPHKTSIDVFVYWGSTKLVW